MIIVTIFCIMLFEWEELEEHWDPQDGGERGQHHEVQEHDEGGTGSRDNVRTQPLLSGHKGTTFI